MGFLNRTSHQSPFIKNVSTEKKGHWSLMFGQPQYATCWNANNITYFSVMGNVENRYEQYMYSFNHLNNELLGPYSWGKHPLGDFHCQANIIVSPEGHIITFNESDHNDEVVVKRSKNINDISEFEIIAVINDVRVAYPLPSVVDRRIYLYGRERLSYSYLTYSDDCGVTWQPSRRVLNIDSVGDNQSKWCYPRPCFIDNKAIYISTQRDGNGMLANNYSFAFGVKIEGTQISNFKNDFTKDLSDGIPLTNALTQQHYFIGDLDFIGGCCADTEDRIFVIADVDKVYLIENGVSSLVTQLSFVDFPVIVRSSVEFLKKKENNFILIMRVQDTDNKTHIVKIETFDSFSTYSIKPIAKSDDNFSFMVARNYNKTKQSALIIMNRKLFSSGEVVDPINSYSDFIVLDDVI